ADVQQRVTTALSTLDPDFKPDYIGAAPFLGFREVVVSGQILYVSDDGHYLMQAQPYDIHNKKFAVSEGLLAYRHAQLATVPQSQRIVFAPKNPKYTISVFTDIECGYCRKLHSEIAELNKRGIAVEYLAFPRMGLGSQDYKDMVSVWCASDRKQALTAAKAGQQIQNKNCNNPVALEYTLGQRIGVNGTPAIFAADGTQLGGYLPPEKLRALLDTLATATTKGN
ncbi:MAG TPA: DsbC family protein, partial [Xylella taiwanensis]